MKIFELQNGNNKNTQNIDNLAIQSPKKDYMFLIWPTVYYQEKYVFTIFGHPVSMNCTVFEVCWGGGEYIIPDHKETETSFHFKILP